MWAQATRDTRSCNCLTLCCNRGLVMPSLTSAAGPPPPCQQPPLISSWPPFPPRPSPPHLSSNGPHPTPSTK